MQNTGKIHDSINTTAHTQYIRTISKLFSTTEAKCELVHETSTGYLDNTEGGRDYSGRLSTQTIQHVWQTSSTLHVSKNDKPGCQQEARLGLYTQSARATRGKTNGCTVWCLFMASYSLYTRANLSMLPHIRGL